MLRNCWVSDEKLTPLSGGGARQKVYRRNSRLRESGDEGTEGAQIAVAQDRTRVNGGWRKVLCGSPTDDGYGDFRIASCADEASEVVLSL